MRSWELKVKDRSSRGGGGGEDGGLKEFGFVTTKFPYLLIGSVIFVFRPPPSVPSESM